MDGSQTRTRIRRGPIPSPAYTFAPTGTCLQHPGMKHTPNASTAVWHRPPGRPSSTVSQLRVAVASETLCLGGSSLDTAASWLCNPGQMSLPLSQPVMRDLVLGGFGEGVLVKRSAWYTAGAQHSHCYPCSDHIPPVLPPWRLSGVFSGTLWSHSQPRWHRPCHGSSGEGGLHSGPCWARLAPSPRSPTGVTTPGRIPGGEETRPG